MGMIRIFHKASKQKRKPGWQQALAEEQAWLEGLKKLSVSSVKAKSAAVKKIAPVIPIEKPKAKFVVGGCTKPVSRPDILYKDNPEMLAREIKARERRFAVAPAYNKGGDIFVTDEMMKDITAGLTRRR